MHTMKVQYPRFAACFLVATVLVACLPLPAQEGANPQLDQCIQGKKKKYIGKGTAVGLVTGLLFGFLTGKSTKDTIVDAAGGAIAGSIAGYATWYYKAAGDCLKENPSWIPESEIERSKSYQEAVQETNYDPQQGPLVQVSQIDMATSVKPGGYLDINTTFIVLTPNGEESKITITRKLYAGEVDKDGNITKEEEIPFIGHASEERTMEAGEQVDKVHHLPIAREAKAGVAYRFEFQVTIDNQSSTKSAIVKIEG